MLIEKINRLHNLINGGYDTYLIRNSIDDLVNIAPGIVNGLINRGDRNWEHVEKLSEEVNHLEEGLTQANINLHDRDCRLADMEVTINSLNDKLAFENGIIFNNGNVVKIDATIYQSVINHNRELTILNNQQADMIRRYRGDTEMLGIENVDLNNEISGKDCLIEKQVGIIDRLTDENGRLADKNANQASMIRGYLADIDTLKIRLDASQKNVSIHMDIVGDQARQIRVLKNDLSICRGEMDKLQKAVEGYQRNRVEDDETVRALIDRVNELKGSIKSLEYDKGVLLSLIKLQKESNRINKDLVSKMDRIM